MGDDIIPLRRSYVLSLVERISELEAEIERLRAAGDALANVVKWAKWVSVGDDEHNALKAWQEASRG